MFYLTKCIKLFIKKKNKKKKKEYFVKNNGIVLKNVRRMNI